MVHIHSITLRIEWVTVSALVGAKVGTTVRGKRPLSAAGVSTIRFSCTELCVKRRSNAGLLTQTAQLHVAVGHLSDQMQMPIAAQLQRRISITLCVALFVSALVMVFSVLRAAQRTTALHRQIAPASLQQATATMTTNSAGRPIENVWNYPRPAKAEPITDKIEIIWQAPDGSETTIASTERGYRVIETTHPPTYYIPPLDIKGPSYLRKSSARQTYCEWKGRATYHDFVAPGASSPTVKGRIWSYEDPTSGFTGMKDYLCFYPDSQTDEKKVGTWYYKIAGEKGKAQEGSFYGGVMTSWISGGQKGFKGGPGTFGW